MLALLFLHVLNVLGALFFFVCFPIIVLVEVVEVNLFDIVLHLLHQQINLHCRFVNRTGHSLSDGVGEFLNVFNVLEEVLIKEVDSSHKFIYDF